MKSDGFGIMYESDSCFFFRSFCICCVCMRWAKSYFCMEALIYAAYFVVDTRITQNMPTPTLANKGCTQGLAVNFNIFDHLYDPRKSSDNLRSKVKSIILYFLNRWWIQGSCNLLCLQFFCNVKKNKNIHCFPTSNRDPWVRLCIFDSADTSAHSRRTRIENEGFNKII